MTQLRLGDASTGRLPPLSRPRDCHELSWTQSRQWKDHAVFVRLRTLAATWNAARA